MRELTNKSASIACELAALLMFVEECDVDQVERENLISLARRVSDQLAASMVEQNSKGRSMDNIYTYHSKNDLLMLAQEVAALISCAAYLATIRGEEERLHVMSLTGLAQRLSDELANSLDISTFSDPESQEAKS
ncbi:hypothetical protein PU646_07715 [Klebsiella pneumoniae]|uniref:hypothetical protein n=1 Tax=Klebsiella pneumoniae TaxID=573 RepID=UPI000E2DC4AA|nr:hypothetical protein [Klebsiella pneumoniae]MCM5788904.1 hypothetical protein [Klebsiella pneumoniae]MCM6097496.1 hypothetical protein [Klebsiella pneumoniae]UZL01564.1 hypothetical protein JMW00_04730 [Klebsiella pneumoniae]WOV17030.1 hypothetical protein R5O48_03765 [Klebsiella pneumoniae]WOV32138.1 hypothetical protein R5O45_24320 [Klebsiella pneumoniae]